jgi:hypothetical protein
MKQALIVGVWACAVTLGAAYGGAAWRSRPVAAPQPAHEEKLESRRIRPLTVPIIADGVLKGYISAEFSVLGPKAEGHGEIDPENYFMDEAFRLIYAENKIDFTQMQKTDLAVLTSRITANVNKRTGKNVIKETLVKSFAFIPRDEMQH